METMAALARTAPPLAGTGRRASSAVRPSACLSFAAAGSTRPRGRLGVGLSARSGSAAGARRAVQRGIVASAEVEQSYIMVKPDGVQRGLVGEIISHFEKKGFLLKGLKLFQCSKDLAQEHYKDLKEKPFFPTLIDYITSGPVVCMAWEGVGVVASARKLIGATNPLQAEPGTIRALQFKQEGTLSMEVIVLIMASVKSLCGSKKASSVNGNQFKHLGLWSNLC